MADFNLEAEQLQRRAEQKRCGACEDCCSPYPTWCASWGKMPPEKVAELARRASQYEGAQQRSIQARYDNAEYQLHKRDDVWWVRKRVPVDEVGQRAGASAQYEEVESGDPTLIALKYGIDWQLVHLDIQAEPKLADADHDPYTDGVKNESCLALRAASGRVNDNRAVVSFLYELMRDELPVGKVHELMTRNESVSGTNTAQFTNGGLASYAQWIADRLGVKDPTSNWAFEAVDQHTREMWRIANLGNVLVDQGAAISLKSAVNQLRATFEMPELT